MPIMDPQGRTINYLRLSVTDRCNLRCSYCMPPQGITSLCHTDILSYEELLRIARCAVSLGIEKIRITGGEPLVRRDILPFLHQVAALPGLSQLVLTTNGVLLDRMASELAAAGIQRLNVSLDSLDKSTFARITRGGDLTRVLHGLEEARSCGLPVKLNMVVMRGINDREIADFARLAAESGGTVRFIEYMPAIRESGWQKLVLPGQEILARLEQHFTLLPLEQCAMAGPARNFRISGSSGTVGVITPVSDHFCSRCNRIRVTSTGKAKGCLFADTSIDLKPSLREQSDFPLSRVLEQIIAFKPARHLMNPDDCQHQPFSMASIGG